MSSGLDQGWAWIVLVASFLEHCICGYCLYAIGYFYIVLADEFQDKTLFITWITSVFYFFICISAPLASLMIGRWNCRVTMVTGSLLTTAAFVITAFGINTILVFICFGILGGIGIGLVYNAGYIVLAFNFEKKLNIATGLAVSGCGIGPFILSPIFQTIHQEYGYTGFFLLFGGLTLNVSVIGAVLRPSELEMSTKIARNRSRTPKHKCFDCYENKTIRNSPLLCVGFSTFFYNIGIFLVYLHFPKYAVENNSTEKEISWFLATAGICSCISRILLGMATNSEDISEEIMFCGSYVLLGSATLCLPLFITSHYAKVIYSICLGLYSGTCYVVLNTIVLRLTGPDDMAHGIGFIMVFIGLGTIVGPPLAGFIIENGGTYDISFVISGFSCITGGFLALCNVCFKTETFEKHLSRELEIIVPEKEEIECNQ